MFDGETIAFGTFVQGRSTLHSLDPRTKLLGGAAVMLGAVLTQSWLGLIAPGMVALGAVIAADYRTKELLRDVWSLRFFYLLTILLHLLFDRQGEPLGRVLNLTVTTGGLNAGFFFSAKIALLALLAGVVNRTTHPAAWSKGIESLLPSRGKVGRWLGRPGLTFGLALRMLPTMLGEAARIRTAQKARGLDLTKGGAVGRVRNLLPLLAPLLTATFRRADLMSDAMQARGFILDQPRSSYRPLRFAAADWIALAVCFTAGAMGVALW